MKFRLILAVAATALASALAFGGPTFAKRDGAQRHGGPKSSTVSFAVLLGRNEVNPTTGRRGAGDPDGRGSATVQVHDADTVCSGITVSGIANPTAAHIHAGGKRVNGPIVVPLTAPATGNPGASSGCIDGVSSTLTADLGRHPKRFYVNVHTADFPNGALRGQLSRSGHHG